MVAFWQSALLLSGGLSVICLLLLPVVFLLAISILYFVMDAFGHFRDFG